MRQLAAQPSSPAVLPSSHASSWLRTPSPQTECCGVILMSTPGPRSIGEAPSRLPDPTEASLPAVPLEPVAGDGLTPAQAPSTAQPAARQKRNNTVERMERPPILWIPAAPRTDPGAYTATPRCLPENTVFLRPGAGGGSII